MGHFTKPRRQSTNDINDKLLKNMRWSPILGGSRISLGDSRSSLSPSRPKIHRPFVKGKTMFMSHGTLNLQDIGIFKIYIKV